MCFSLSSQAPTHCGLSAITTRNNNTGETERDVTITHTHTHTHTDTHTHTHTHTRVTEGGCVCACVCLCEWVRAGRRLISVRCERTAGRLQLIRGPWMLCASDRESTR